MSLRTARATTIVSLFFGLFLCCAGAGCSYLSPATVDDDFDLAELDDEGKIAEEVEGESEIDEMEDPDSSSPDLDRPDLDRRVKSGDRFPLSKTIEHRLTQTDNDGTRVSTSRAEIELTLLVDRILSDGRRQMSVKFDRVQFEQHSEGKRIFYSSEKSVEAIPPEAFLYAGLAGNGFSFWIDPTNRVSDVVGFSNFLQRCLRSVPDNFKPNVKRQLEASKADEGVANFIDDSVGMLPYRFDPRLSTVSISQGTDWDLTPRYCESPIPMVTKAHCVLSELSANFADIRLTGQISGPEEPVAVRHTEGEFTVFVKGGRCKGSCRIDRRTGLPTLSQIQRDIDLVIEFPDGQRVEQNKVTFSTFTAQSSLLQRSDAPFDSRVESTSYQSTYRKENPGRAARSRSRVGD